jgi:predicted ATPase
MERSNTLTGAKSATVRHAQISQMTDHSRQATGRIGGRFVVISGCSGGGKSALLTELGQRGYAVVTEPGRRVVQHELQCGGAALPWLDPVQFARRALTTAMTDYESWTSDVPQRSWVFFDRGVIDAAAAIQHLTAEPTLTALERSHRYHWRVFLTPPWAELYLTDDERRHDFNAAVGEYDRLLEVYPALGYEVYILPKTGISERADYVLQLLGPTPD